MNEETRLEAAISNNEYLAVLSEFVSDDRLDKLFRLAEDEATIEREMAFIKDGKYPEERKVIDKIKLDLFLMRNVGGAK